MNARTPPPGSARAEPILITSRDNALLKELRRLAQDNTGYRRQGRLWLEGDHLCRAALERGLKPSIAVFSAAAWPAAPAQWRDCAERTLVVADALWSSISGLESPGRMGFVIALPGPPALAQDAPSVILDRVQDAGNVGSILRSAAAFGLRQVLALEGTAGLWSPKVLRAGMGAHFGLQLLEGLASPELDSLHVPWLVTSSHAGELIHRTVLPWPCAWVFGHEGQGVCGALQQRAALRIRIGQPGGEESLNVAAAAAICLHASASSR